MTDHRTPPQSSKWRGRLAATVIVTAVFIALFVLGGRWWLERHIGETLQTRAQAQGWTLTWESLSLGMDRRLELTGLRGAGPHGEALTVARAEAWFDWRAVLDGQRRPQRVEVRGLNAELDARHLTAGSARAEIAAEMRATRAPGWFEALTKMTTRWSDIDVTLKGLPAPLPETMSITGSTASSGGTAAGWEVIGEGSCAAGCGEARRATLRVEGDRSGRVALFAELDGEPMTLVVPRPDRAGSLAVSLKGIAAVHQPDEALRVALRAVRTRAAARGWGAEISTDAVEFELDEARRPVWPVTLKRPEVTVERLTQAQREFDAQRAPGAQEERAEDSRGSNEAGDLSRVEALSALSGKQWLERVLKWRPEQSEELVDWLLDSLRRVRVEGGRVRWGARTLEGITVEPSEDTLTIGLRHHGEWSARVRRGDAEVHIGLKDVSLAAWTGVLEHKGWWPSEVSMSGRVSGTLTWRPGVEMPAPEMRVRPSPPRGVTREAGQRVRAEVTIARGSLKASALSEEAVEVAEAKLRVELLGAPAHKRRADWWVVREASLTLPSRAGGETTLHGEVELRHLLDGRPAAVAARVRVDEAPCARAVGSLPAGMLPNLSEVLTVEGRFSPSLSMSVNMADPEQVSLSIEGLPGSCRVTALGPHDPSWLNTDFVRPVREGVSEGQRVEIGPGTADYVKLSAMPAWVGAAAYLSEEAAFYRNKGFAPGLIRRAIGMNLKGRRYVYGGSSVSQQLVKNLFLTRTKTLSRKLEEAFIVWRMEELVSKDRILELYLNCIEFGPDLYGIGRASQAYFGKPATRLSPLEASFLAAIKPAPWLGARFATWGHSPSKGWWRDRLGYLMERLHEKGFISEEALQVAAPYVVALRRRAFSGSR